MVGLKLIVIAAELFPGIFVGMPKRVKGPICTASDVPLRAEGSSHGPCSLVREYRILRFERSVLPTFDHTAVWLNPPGLEPTIALSKLIWFGLVAKTGATLSQTPVSCTSTSPAKFCTGAKVMLTFDESGPIWIGANAAVKLKF